MRIRDLPEWRNWSLGDVMGVIICTIIIVAFIIPLGIGTWYMVIEAVFNVR